MVFRVQLTRCFSVMFGMKVMAMRGMGMVRRRLRVLIVVMHGGLPMMVRGLLVMRGSGFVMFRDFVR